MDVDRVDYCEYKKGLVVGRVDNEPLNEYAGKVKLGSQLTVSYAQVREYKKSADFKSKK
jgi:hypothetical protein